MRETLHLPVGGTLKQESTAEYISVSNSRFNLKQGNQHPVLRDVECKNFDFLS